MKELASTLIFIIPIIGLIGGLSLGITIPLFLISCLYIIKTQVKLDFKNFKLELLLFTLFFLSCIWSINTITTFLSVIKTLSLALVTYILIINRTLLSRKLPLDKQKFLTTCIISLILFYIEFFSNGLISLWFRESFQSKESHHFYLHYLDRGCTLLALFAWIVIAELIRKHRLLIATILYFMVLITLHLSDSLAAFVGFIVSGLVFLLTKYTFLRNPRTLSLILVTGSLAFLTLMALQNPKRISEEYDFLPLSAKHRLFIWQFTLNKTIDKPVLGWGHGASRNFDIQESDIVNYKDHKLNPLPTHPHNNILQILLENGVIGLIIYLSLACKYLFKWNKLFLRQKSKRLLSIQAAGYACFSNFFIISMISFNMWQSWWLCSFLWVAILLCLIATSAHHKRVIFDKI